MFNALEPWHLLIIVGAMVLLFGGKRLPGAARSLGQTMRTFRSEMAQGRSEQDEDAEATHLAPGAGVAPAALVRAASAPVAAAQVQASSGSTTA